MTAALKRKLNRAYQTELDAAYRGYYAERHQWEDMNLDPNEWELQLWDKWEEVFFEIYRRHHE